MKSLVTDLTVPLKLRAAFCQAPLIQGYYDPLLRPVEVLDLHDNAIRDEISETLMDR